MGGKACGLAPKELVLQTWRSRPRNIRVLKESGIPSPVPQDFQNQMSRQEEKEAKPRVEEEQQTSHLQKRCLCPLVPGK